MKVILIKDVKGMGRAHTEVEVSDGHALNLLIPKKLAIPATAAARAAAAGRQKRATDRAEVDAALLAQNIASLAEVTLVIKAKANEQGHLYTSVNEADLVAAAKAQASVDLPEEAIRLEKPIKELGTFTIPVSLGELFGSFSATIEAA